MTGYHTTIEIDAPIEKVWAELLNIADYPAWNPLVKDIRGELKEGNRVEVSIIPLKSKFKVMLTAFRPHQEMTWKGGVVASWLVCAEHYYKLEVTGSKTKLLHGETFTGILSYLMPSFVKNRMRKIFEKHNWLLKQRIENGK